MHIAVRNLFLFTSLSVILSLNAATAFAQDDFTQIAKNDAEESESKKEDEKTKTPDFSKTEIKINPGILTRVGVSQSATIPLSLNEAIRRALENNNTIEIARDDVRIQETQIRSLLGFYNPTINANPVYSRSATTGRDATNDFRIDSSVVRQIRPGGGNVNAFFNNSQVGRASSNNTTFNQTANIAPSASTTYFSTLGVNYNQPLFRNFKIDNQRRQIKIQKKRLQQSDADFRRNIIEVITQVQLGYWDLVFALRDQQNRVANLNLAQENLRLIEARIEAGAAAPLARAEVATELATRETDVINATQQVAIAENNLKTLLLREPTAPEWSKIFVPTDSPVFSFEPIALDDAVKDAVDNRPELRRLRLQNEINDIDISYFKNQVKPRLDLNSAFSLGGLAFGDQPLAGGTSTFPLIVGDPNTNVNVFLLNAINQNRIRLNALSDPNNPLPPITPPPITVANTPAFFSGGSIQAIQNLFRSDAPNYSVGVTFSFPVGNQTAKANLVGARISQEQNDAQMRLQEQTIIAEVRNAVQAVETSRQRVLSARSAVENAQIQLDGERKLYEVGRSTQFLLFQRENTLTNARNSLIRAETDYNKALADLQRATSTTFLTNNIEVESPTDNK